MSRTSGLGLPVIGVLAPVAASAQSGAAAEREMAERRERLQLSKNDYVIGCPLCLAEFPSQQANADNNDQQ